VSKSFKNKEFHLTPKVLFRLSIFIILSALSINYFSSQRPIVNPDVLGTQTVAPSDMPLVKTVVDNLYNQLPEESRNLIENLNKSPILLNAQDKLNFIKTETSGFPQKQIKDIKDFFINKGKDLLNNASEKNK
jgi:hypothetical protein